MDHYRRKDIGVAIPDGSGYVGTLNMWHEIHCIASCPVLRLILDVLSLTLLQKRLHQYMYQDYYFKNSTPRQKEKNRLHNGKPFQTASLILALINTTSRQSTASIFSGNPRCATPTLASSPSIGLRRAACQSQMPPPTNASIGRN